MDMSSSTGTVPSKLPFEESEQEALTMRDKVNRSRIRVRSLMVASLSAAFLLASVTASAQTQAGSDSKLPCVGCAVDGKTPRFPDEHPNLNGFWNTPPRADNPRQVEK